MVKVNEKSPPIHRLLISTWLLSAATVAVSLTAWGQSYNWNVLPLEPYRLFPLLGLIAFGLMWSHYMTGAMISIAQAAPQRFKQYFRYTGYAVFVCLLLHPGLLIYQRYRDGFGLPPDSYTSYVAPGLSWVVFLGTLSFVIFMAYEFHRIFENRSWWHFVTEAGDIAMLAILFHVFKLGSQLQMNGWFRVVWLLYTVTFVLVLLRTYRQRYFIKSVN